MEKKKLYHK